MVIFHSYVSLPEGKGILQIFSCKKERGRSTSHGHLSINPFPRFIDDKFAIDFLHCKGPQKRIDPTDPTPKRLVMCLTWGTYEGRMCVFFHPPFRKTNSQVRWSGMLRVGVFVAMCGDSPWWQSPSQASAFFSGTNEVPEGFWSWTQQQLGCNGWWFYGGFLKWGYPKLMGVNTKMI